MSTDLKITLVDLATNETFGEFTLAATAMFQVTKALRTRYKCDEDDLACVHDTDFGSDVTVRGEVVARMNCSEAIT